MRRLTLTDIIIGSLPVIIAMILMTILINHYVPVAIAIGYLLFTIIEWRFT